MSDWKPMIITDEMTLVNHDLSNVYRYLTSGDTPEYSSAVQFKKKEKIWRTNVKLSRNKYLKSEV